jgi:hypothetical protein
MFLDIQDFGVNSVVTCVVKLRTSVFFLVVGPLLLKLYAVEGVLNIPNEKCSCFMYRIVINVVFLFVFARFHDHRTALPCKDERHR